MPGYTYIEEIYVEMEDFCLIIIIVSIILIGIVVVSALIVGSKADDYSEQMYREYMKQKDSLEEREAERNE